MERRPVPFAVKFQKVHPGTTGVTVLHHLERLDQVEASLQRLTVDEVDEEEQDVAESAARARPMPLRTSTEGDSPIAGPSRVATSAPVSPFSPPTSPPPMHALLEGEERQPASAASSEEDLVTMSKSVSYVDGNSPGHSRWASQSNNRGLEWLQTADVPAKKIVIVEVSVSFSCIRFWSDKSAIAAFGDSGQEAVVFVLVVGYNPHYLFTDITVYMSSILDIATFL